MKQKSKHVTQFPTFALGDAFSIVEQKFVGGNRIAEYRIRNAAYLQPWEPTRTDDYFSAEVISSTFRNREFDLKKDNTLRLGILSKESDSLVGVVNITNIVGHPFCACNIGFSLDQDHQGQGYMKGALSVIVPVIFQKFQMNRIMANFMPRNFRSARLLQDLGFEVEGFARRYLKINGKWEDHILTSRISDVDLLE